MERKEEKHLNTWDPMIYGTKKKKKKKKKKKASSRVIALYWQVIAET